MEKDHWKKVSGTYDETMFSLTKFPERRKQIIDHISKGRILNLGAGSTAHLNYDLIDQGNSVFATDFCKEMMQMAKRTFDNPKLTYVVADSRSLPFTDGFFDSVVSVNSILPPERSDMDLMIREVYRILKPEGTFVAFLVSYDSVKEFKEELNLATPMDEEELRVDDGDGSGWQCYHTPESIDQMMSTAGFKDYRYEKIFLDTKFEITELKRIYNIDFSEHLIHEYLLVAHK